MLVHQAIIKQPEVAEIKKVAPEKVLEKIEEKEINAEDIGDVLADLSDEELVQLAAMYKTGRRSARKGTSAPCIKLIHLLANQNNNLLN